MGYCVDYNKYKCKYRLRLRMNGKNEHIGYYDTEREAVEEGEKMWREKRNIPIT